MEREGEGNNEWSASEDMGGSAGGGANADMENMDYLTDFLQLNPGATENQKCEAFQSFIGESLQQIMTSSTGYLTDFHKHLSDLHDDIHAAHEETRRRREELASALPQTQDIMRELETQVGSFMTASGTGSSAPHAHAHQQQQHAQQHVPGMKRTRTAASADDVHDENRGDDVAVTDHYSSEDSMGGGSMELTSQEDAHMHGNAVMHWRQQTDVVVAAPAWDMEASQGDEPATDAGDSQPTGASGKAPLYTTSAPRSEHC